MGEDKESVVASSSLTERSEGSCSGGVPRECSCRRRSAGDSFEARLFVDVDADRYPPRRFARRPRTAAPLSDNEQEGDVDSHFVPSAGDWESRWVTSTAKDGLGKMIVSAGKYFGDEEAGKGEQPLLPSHCHVRCDGTGGTARDGRCLRFMILSQVFRPPRTPSSTPFRPR